MPGTENTEATDWTKPFIFISYSHDNDAVTQKLIELLKNAGYRVWYDTYINSGENWRDMIGESICNCTHFIAVINNEYLESPDCKSELEFATDKPFIKMQNIVCRPITPIYCDGATRDMLSAGLRMYLRSYQDCTLDQDEELTENSRCFRKLIENTNIAKCKIDESSPPIPSLSEDSKNEPTKDRENEPTEDSKNEPTEDSKNEPTEDSENKPTEDTVDIPTEENTPPDESIIAQPADTLSEELPVIISDNTAEPEMTTYMVKSALADRAHNAALLFSKADKKIGRSLYKAAYRSRNSLINRYPENEKENAKFSDLCSHIKAFACEHNIDVREFFNSDTPDEVQTELSDNTAAYNYDMGIKLKNEGKTDEAEKYLRTAAESDMPEAQLSLGVLLYNLNRKDDAEKYFRLAADNGAAKAQYNLGVLLIQSNRKTEAENYIRLSADNDFIPACLSLGHICQKKNNLNDAEKYYRKAADGGLTEAQYSLGMLLKATGRSTESTHFLQLAAEKGHAGARSELAKIT